MLVHPGLLQGADLGPGRVLGDQLTRAQGREKRSSKGRGAKDSRAPGELDGERVPFGVADQDSLVAAQVPVVIVALDRDLWGVCGESGETDAL